MNLTFVLCELAIPAIVTLGLALALPYVVAHSIVPLFGKLIIKLLVNLHVWDSAISENIFFKLFFCFLVPSRQYRALIARRVYPSFLVVILLMGFSVWQLKQFKRLYEHIKNDK